MTSSDRYAEIWESLRDPEYREQFVAEEINVGLAFQIRSLRDRQKLTQEDLAKKMKRHQPLVSAWEDPNYGKHTLSTLKDLAKAFDVGLHVRFVPFSMLVDWTADMTPDTIAPPSFGDDAPRNALIVNLQKIGVDANRVSSATPAMMDANRTVDFWVPKANETVKEEVPVHA